MATTRNLPLLILFSLIASLASALPVQPPVEREVTASDGRSIQVKIVGVTDTALEFVRAEDGARFSLPLDRLAEADRAFAARLLETARLAQPLPDTAFLRLLRKDFLRASPDRKSLAPLPADAFSRAPRLVLVVDDQFSGTHPVWTQRHMEGLEVEKFAVLWLPGRGDALEIGLAASTLPEAHAILAAPSLARAEVILLEQTRLMQDEQFKRRRPESSDGVWYPFATVEEESAWQAKVRAKLPDYWPRLPYVAYNTRQPVRPAAFVVGRDGRPVIFRGEPLAGNIRTVFKVLRENADEFK